MNGPAGEKMAGKTAGKTSGRLQDTWYGGREPGFLLTALERVYAGVSSARRRRARPEEALEGRPVVVVGNITAGGTGKTPLVIRLCELLAARDLAAAVVSRGYGRRGSGPVNVTADTSAEEGGDEPVLIARRCRVPVFVDEDREAASLAAFGAGAAVVLSDDGLQRLSLPRTMELCVVDAARGFGNGHLLPAGPLREPVERLETVDWIICNGDPQGLFDDGTLDPAWRARTIEMRLAPTSLRRLGTTESLSADMAIEVLGGEPLTALAGMGHPERFFATLESLGLHGFDRRPFPDHHPFTREDFDGIRGPVVMTEKDAVKCEALGLDDAWCLQVGAVLPPEWERRWLDALSQNLE